MNAFRLHRQALEYEIEGRILESDRCYLSALDSFQTEIAGGQLRTIALDAARQNPDPTLEHEALADRFVRELPGWLCEFHFEKFHQALIKKNVSVARFHWQLLCKAADCHAETRSRQLRRFRDTICERFEINMRLISTQEADRNRVLDYSERVVRADSGNGFARKILILGYTEHIVDSRNKLNRSKSSSSKKDKRNPHPRMREMTPGEQRKLGRKLKKHHQKLSRYMSGVRRKKVMSEEDLFQPWQVLTLHFLSTGKRGKAKQCLRQIRRIGKNNSEARQWARQFRRQVG